MLGVAWGQDYSTTGNLEVPFSSLNEYKLQIIRIRCQINKVQMSLAFHCSVPYQHYGLPTQSGSHHIIYS